MTPAQDEYIDNLCLSAKLPRIRLGDIHTRADASDAIDRLLGMIPLRPATRQAVFASLRVTKFSKEDMYAALGISSLSDGSGATERDGHRALQWIEGFVTEKRVGTPPASFIDGLVSLRQDDLDKMAAAQPQGDRIVVPAPTPAPISTSPAQPNRRPTRPPSRPASRPAEPAPAPAAPAPAPAPSPVRPPVRPSSPIRPASATPVAQERVKYSTPRTDETERRRNRLVAPPDGDGDDDPHCVVERGHGCLWGVASMPIQERRLFLLWAERQCRDGVVKYAQYLNRGTSSRRAA